MHEGQHTDIHQVAGETDMTLHGICAPEGTVIGLDFHSGRFVAVSAESCDFVTPTSEMVLRFATPEELNSIGIREPRSVCEHLGIPLRMTPYGPARMFGPRPRVKPKRLSKSEARRILDRFGKKYPQVANYQPPDVIDG